MIESAIAAVGRVSSVPQILRVITEMTGLRLSLVAHVTDDRWTCCAVNDRLEFGLEVGGTLDVATTLCREVRARRAPIIISHASCGRASTSATSARSTPGRSICRRRRPWRCSSCSPS